MIGSPSTSERLSSPRWPGGARIEKTPAGYPLTFKATRPIDSTSVNCVVLSGKDWEKNNAAKIMSRSRVEVATTAEERVAQALEAAAIDHEKLQETLRLDMTNGINLTNTTITIDVYRGPEKWTSGSRQWEPPKKRSDIKPLMFETKKLTKPGPNSERRTSPRWEGGNRLDRDYGSTKYAPDFTESILTKPGLDSDRRTSPRWEGGNRLDRARGPPEIETPHQEQTIFSNSNSKQVGSCLQPPTQWQ
jgi:hypothetical protein